MKNVVNPAGMIALIVLAASFFSCSNSKTYDDAMQENRDRIEEPGRLGDALFLVEIRSLIMFQLELLKVAAESGYSAELVNLGKDNIEPFQTLDNDVVDVAKKEKFRLPTEMSEDHIARLAAVKRASRQEIDQMLVSEMAKANSEAVQKLTAQATEGSDPDVRAFAARIIGALRVHNDSIRRVKDGLLTSFRRD